MLIHDAQQTRLRQLHVWSPADPRTTIAADGIREHRRRLQLGGSWCAPVPGRPRIGHVTHGASTVAAMN